NISGFTIEANAWGLVVQRWRSTVRLSEPSYCSQHIFRSSGCDRQMNDSKVVPSRYGCCACSVLSRSPSEFYVRPQVRRLCGCSSLLSESPAQEWFDPFGSPSARLLSK